MIRIGKIARPHGVRGMVAVTLDDPESRTLFSVREAHVGETPYAITRVAPGRKGQVLLQLRGVATPEQAEQLRDLEVKLKSEQLPALQPGEYWYRDLLQMEAFDEEGALLGPVVEIVDTADVAVLVVQRAGDQVFVPFTEPHLIEVDVARRRLTVQPPEAAD